MGGFPIIIWIIKMVSVVMNMKAHWENIYQTKDPTQVSWYQAHPHISLGLIQRTGIPPNEPIIDIGGGTSTLVDDLLANGYQSITVLDISAQALTLTRRRLEAADHITWLEADITEVTWCPGPMRSGMIGQYSIF